MFDYDNIKHFLLMNLHIFSTPLHTTLTIQFTIQHSYIIVLAFLHHNLEFQRRNTDRIGLSIAIMIELRLGISIRTRTVSFCTNHGKIAKAINLFFTEQLVGTCLRLRIVMLQ